MNVDDILYLGLLIFSMGFGFYYRKIEDPEKKKIIGGALGLTIVTIVSGSHILHVLITTSVAAVIILYGDKRKCHVYTFTFCFLYLFFFRSAIFFGIPYAPSHTNLVQMMLTLKLIGLAFEVSKSLDLEKKNDNAIKTEEELLEDETNKVNPTILDIYCYVFNYCGVLTGPYFRYRTFQDHLYKPYHKYDNFNNALMKRFYLIPIVGVIHLLTNYYWPLSYVHTDEFLERPFLYRYWYIWPTFLIFRTRIYFGLMLTEIVCILGGLGVYPAFTKPKSGHGPSQEFKRLKELSNPEELKSLEYDYTTVNCIRVLETEFCPTMREAMKHWNITIQYWLASYVYKQFPYKKYRTIVTMLVSAIWHGVYAGYYFCIATVPFALMYEDIWAKLLLNENVKGTKLQISKVVMQVLKMQMFSYQGIAFSLLEINKVFRYYNCVYHCVPVFYISLYFLGKFLLKQKKLDEKMK